MCTCVHVCSTVLCTLHALHVHVGVYIQMPISSSDNRASSGSASLRRPTLYMKVSVNTHTPSLKPVYSASS